MHSEHGRRSPGRTLLVGCGKLGIRLGERLIAGGQEVIAIRRSVGEVPDGFQAVTQDLRLAPPRDLPACESMVITLPPDAAERSDGDIYAPALASLAEGLPSRPSRTVFVSSTRVFEGRPGVRPLTESDTPAPVGDRAIALLEGERIASRLFDACIVRPAGIYGPGRDSVIGRVRSQTPFDYSRRTNRVHEHDLVTLLHALLRAEDPPPRVHAVDQAPTAMGDVVTFIAECLGLDQPPRVTPETSGGTVLDGHLMIEIVGALQYPSFREGYAQLIREAGNSGKQGLLARPSTRPRSSGAGR